MIGVSGENSARAIDLLEQHHTDKLMRPCCRPECKLEIGTFAQAGRHTVGAADDEARRRPVLRPPFAELGRECRAVEAASALVEDDHDRAFRDNIGDGNRFFDAAALDVLRRAVTDWAKGKAFDFNITAPSERSDTVTTILMADGRDPGPLQDYCNAKCGVVLGAGFGEMAGKAFRIAHMGHVNAPTVLGVLGVVEMGLKALGIPHGGEGVRAAIDWLGKSVTP